MKTKIKMYKENTQIQDFILIFLKILFYVFREGKGERKRGKHQCMVVSHMPLTGDLACNLGMWPDWELNQQLWFTGWCSIHWATPARAKSRILKKYCLYQKHLNPHESCVYIVFMIYKYLLDPCTVLCSVLSTVGLSWLRKPGVCPHGANGGADQWSSTLFISRHM